MFEKINRPYKESSAKDTVEGIKNILKSVGIVPRITSNSNPYPEIYSIRLELDKDQGKFGTNGKGRTMDYALASGYAEFLERMQNGLYGMFSRTNVTKLKNEHGFYYSPEEKYLSKEEFSALPDSIIEDIIRYRGEMKEKFISSYFERLKVNNVPGVVTVPFYDTKNKCRIFLPVNLILMTIGSNGMAAGNTVAEALFQAICEIIERWSASEIFYNQITPPSVPREFLKRFEKEYSIIESIEKSGKYKVIAKDFSANKQLPALGLIIENLESKTYRLNVGSDTSFQVALSRCLTEVYQGVENEERFDSLMLNISEEVPDYFIKDDEAAMLQRYLVFGQFTKNASGQFPPSLFCREPDYAFDPEVFTTHESYEKEVRFLISSFHGNGYNVYIRDVSYMGFPSVLVYIPEVSAKGRKNALLPVKSSETFNAIELDKLEDLFFDLENRSEDGLRQIGRSIDVFDPNDTITGLFNINLESKSPWGNVNLSFFSTLLWFQLGELQKARESFGKFLANREDKDKNEYYRTVERYLELKTEGCSENEILEKILEAKYPESVAKEVMKDLSDPGNIFKNIKLPKCPDCLNCHLKDDCLTKNKMEVANKLYPVMRENIIDQEELCWVVDIKERQG